MTEEEVQKALKWMRNRNQNQEPDEEATEENPEERGQIESPFRIIEPFIEEAHRIAQEYDLPWPTKNPFENLPQLPERHVEREQKTETAKQVVERAPEPTVTCPDCQAPNYLSSNFCRKCGTRLKEETQKEWVRTEKKWEQQPVRDPLRRRHSPGCALEK